MAGGQTHVSDTNVVERFINLLLGGTSGDTTKTDGLKL